MSEFSQDIIRLAERNLLPPGLVLLVFIVIIFLSRKKVKQKWLDIKTYYRLNRLGVKQISDFQCPDGLGHYFTIDRLILRHDGITLLLCKRFPGRIFCAENIDDWTQMFDRQSYRFKNPLYDLDIQIKAVSACVPGVSVDGFLFFDHTTEFPKGHPDRVVHLRNIPEGLKRNTNTAVSAPVMVAWEKLVLMAGG